MALKPSLVNLPVFITTQTNVTLPNYLGYVNANPTANATFILPKLESYSEGAWTQIKNQSAYTITINDNNGNNIGSIQANSVGEYISSSVGWIDYSVSAAGIIPSDLNIPGYLNVGSSGPPLNITTGDTTTKRLFVGTPVAPSTKEIVHVQATTSIGTDFISVNGIVAITGSGDVSAYRGNVNTTGATGSFGNLTGFVTGIFHNSSTSITNNHGVQASIMTQAGFNGGIIANQNGMSSNISHSGAGTITNCRGYLASVGTGGSAGTITNYSGFEVNFINSAAITTLAAFKFSSLLGATNRYGIWSNSNSADPSGGMVFGTAADTSFYRGTANQLLTPGDWKTRHYLGSSTPTIAAGTGAGTSPTITVTGYDQGFRVNLTTGSSPSAGAVIFTITFGATFPSGYPNSANATAMEVNAAGLTGTYVSSLTQTQMVFRLIGTLAATTVYIWSFTIN